MPTEAEPVKESVSQSVSRSRRVAFDRVERSRGRLSSLFNFLFFFFLSFILFSPPARYLSFSFSRLVFLFLVPVLLPVLCGVLMCAPRNSIQKKPRARAVRQRDYSELSSNWNAERDLRDLGTVRTVIYFAN